MVNDKNIIRMNIISQLVSGLITNEEAASALSLSVRSIQRLNRKTNEFGIEAVLHGNRGKQAHNAISIADKNFIINLALNEFEAYNFSHFRYVLEEDYNINISRSSLHRILK